MMFKSLEELTINGQTTCRKVSHSGNWWKMLPNALQEKNTEIETKLAKGVHPQSLGARKIRCLPNLYRMRMSRSYRMLIGLEDNHWTSLGLYSRQSFTTLLNRRRR
jgi:radical S-adenosyl methionine domain-containing protein 2